MSRLTFRDRCEGVAWQKQLRDRYLPEGSPPVCLDLATARVRPVSLRLARQIILKYEWLGTLPAGSGHFYGIFFGPYCAGVTVFGIGGGGANVNAHLEWGVGRHELAYLARGACVHWAPPGTNSKLVAWSCRLLAQKTKVRLAIAYADTDAGEVGTIYQAANWICVGRTASTRQWIAPNGRIFDQKLPYDLKRRRGYIRSAWTQALRAAGWQEQTTNPKYRYVYLLDRTDAALAARVQALSQPYPKRCERPSASPAPR